MTEIIVLIIGLLLGYLSQYLIDRSRSRRENNAQLRVERRTAHVAFLSEVRQFTHDMGLTHFKGIDAYQPQHRPLKANARGISDLLPALELIATKESYDLASQVRGACDWYENSISVGAGAAVDEAVSKYLKSVRRELGLSNKNRPLYLPLSGETQ